MQVTPRLFRGLLLASIALGIAGAVVDYAFPSLIPEVLSEAQGKLDDANFESHGLSGLGPIVIAAVILAAVTVVGCVGLFLFRRWGRSAAMLSTALSLPVLLFAGATVQSGWASLLYELATLLWGAVLAIAYFAPLSARFGSPVPGTQSLPEPPAASPRGTLGTIALIIGSGIAGILIFAAAGVGFFYYKILDWSTTSTEKTFPPEHSIAIPPPISDSERFLGSHGVTIGDFGSDRDNVLASGPGQLVGKVTARGKPVEGLKLRLALNGSVYSQWAVSDAQGRYEVKVPYADYRIDGFRMDSTSANKVLGGLIGNPANSHARGRMTVAEGRPGRALDLDHVDPVRKDRPFGEVSGDKPVVISWHAYPGATQYQLQLVEHETSNAFGTQKRLFEWKKQPLVAATSYNLTEHGVRLKKGRYYAVEIEALDASRRRLSESARDHRGPDFHVAD